MTAWKRLKIIAEKSYSQIPVYHGDQFKGILTTSAIADGWQVQVKK
ncbi:hypothetical protein PHOSAC3_120364 [Mesotoga infera]|nr:hypothetical protein PHOSAC3_120364 [Mesotoga infera]